MPVTIPGKLVITAPDQDSWEVVLDKPVLHIGRLPEPDNDLTLVHGLISRRHAQLFCDHEPYRIVDLGSSNGTSVNDIPLPANEIRELRDGDRIVMGPFTLHYSAPRGEPDEPAEPEPELDLFAGLRLVEAPDAPPPEKPPSVADKPEELPFEPWVGMARDRSRWLQYLPYIYAEHPFLGRYLLILEDIFGPLDQAIAHFDLFLDPRTAPESFLPVLAGWLGLVLDDRWPPKRRRAILQSAVELYDFIGTQKGLIRLLEASTECRVEVAENTDGPHTFRVTVTPAEGTSVDEQMVRYLIDTYKPAHTVYRLQIQDHSKG